jgi:hypothetical protein
MGFDGFFLSAEFIRRWEGEPPSEPNLSARCEVQFLRAQKIFFGSAGALPSRNLPFHHSPVAIRYSPSFWLGRSLALPFFSSLVPRPTTRFKSVSTKTKPSKAG